ncbi:MAG: protein kinase [Proteobacteria bacterium]|nr:protein kinase [Pseudomonadota bacterium]
MESGVQEQIGNTTQAGMASIHKSLVDKRDSAQFDIGEVIADRYKIVKILGVGGFGIVYECEDSQQNKHIALKTLKHNIPDYTRAAKRFEREIALSQELQSEHTVKVFDAGVAENDTLYFAMELLTGETLEAFIERRERFTFLETKKLVLQILDSLREAHQKGVVHRDLKPSNISLEPRVETSGDDTYTSHDFHVRVLDFGIAKIIDTETGEENAEKLTKTGAWIGSPAYMCPELLKGGEVTPAADIYAVGLIMYEMLVAHQAIYGSSAIEIAVQQMSADPIPIDDWIMESSFGSIITRCVEKDRDMRYQNASSLYDSIAALDDDVLKKEYTSAKLKSFASTKRQQTTGNGSINSVPTTSMTAVSTVISEDEFRQRRLQQGLIFGIALCVTLIVTVVIVKMYVDKRINLENVITGLAEEEPNLKQYQKDILQSASLGALMGALDPMRVRVTIVASPAETKIYRASDNVEIGASGSAFDIIRSLSQWNLVLKADGYEDYNLPVTPMRFETLTVTLNRKLPPPPPWMKDGGHGGPPPLPPGPPQEVDPNGQKIDSDSASQTDQTDKMPDDTASGKTTTSDKSTGKTTTSGKSTGKTTTSGKSTGKTTTSGKSTGKTTTSGKSTGKTTTSGKSSTGKTNSKNVYSVD